MWVELKRERETKNKVVFEEVGLATLLGTLYVPKATLEQLGNPEQITIDVQAKKPLEAVA